MAAMAVVHG